MKRVLVILAAALLSLLAFANVAAATGPWSYQPEVPDKLLK
ncbi:Staphylococcal AgrD [Moorella glycerini]|uniref:Cyclic lactone autoinducer peptide n=1 Tax=Neomoorella stamsii TaxID=1266720 RepID=A0A9X7J4Q4_9FIRM|nr:MULTISPECIES: cyclic lactone autoinducer peptide [Moorella]PRR74837.1 hypothetical protein MOST_09450 [Moorella stamsii]CEP67977.1 Staphylococcal AgrD [Moorella glycerini]